MSLGKSSVEMGIITSTTPMLQNSWTETDNGCKVPCTVLGIEEVVSILFQNQGFPSPMTPGQGAAGQD